MALGHLSSLCWSELTEAELAYQEAIFRTCKEAFSPGSGEQGWWLEAQRNDAAVAGNSGGCCGWAPLPCSEGQFPLNILDLP